MPAAYVFDRGPAHQQAKQKLPSSHHLLSEWCRFRAGVSEALDRVKAAIDAAAMVGLWGDGA